MLRKEEGAGGNPPQEVTTTDDDEKSVDPYCKVLQVEPSGQPCFFDPCRRRHKSPRCVTRCAVPAEEADDGEADPPLYVAIAKRNDWVHPGKLFS